MHIFRASRFQAPSKQGIFTFSISIILPTNKHSSYVRKPLFCNLTKSRKVASALRASCSCAVDGRRSGGEASKVCSLENNLCRLVLPIFCDVRRTACIFWPKTAATVLEHEEKSDRSFIRQGVSGLFVPMFNVKYGCCPISVISSTDALQRKTYPPYQHM